jgi:chemotaxis protein MotB
MAFFMVMWIMGLSDETKAQVAGYFNDPLGFKKSETRSKWVVSPKSVPGSRSQKQKFGDPPSVSKPQSAQRDEDKLKNVKKKFEAAMASDKELAKLMKHVEITITQDGLRIELVESTDAGFFETGSAVLSPIARKLIAKLTPVLKQQDRYFVVEGHTDSRPYASQTYTNWDLSGDRAMALWRELHADGASEHRLTGVRALADTQLKYPGNPYDDRNRRVTILLPFKVDKTDGVKLPKDELPEGPAGHMPDVVVAPHLGPK